MVELLLILLVGLIYIGFITSKHCSLEGICICSIVFNFGFMINFILELVLRFNNIVCVIALSMAIVVHLVMLCLWVTKYIILLKVKNQK